MNSSATLLLPLLVSVACTEPGETRVAPVNQARFPARVGVDESFTVDVQVRDLFCGEWGELIKRVRIDNAIRIEVEWRDIKNSGDVCDDPGGHLFFTPVPIERISRPAGSIVAVRSGSSLFGTIEVVATPSP